MTWCLRSGRSLRDRLARRASQSGRQAGRARIGRSADPPGRRWGSSALLVLMMVLNRPRVDLLWRNWVPPLLPVERQREMFPILSLQTMRASALLLERADWQRRHLRRLGPGRGNGQAARDRPQRDPVGHGSSRHAAASRRSMTHSDCWTCPSKGPSPTRSRFAGRSGPLFSRRRSLGPPGFLRTSPGRPRINPTGPSRTWT